MPSQISVVVVDDERGRTKKWAEALLAAAGDRIASPVLLEGQYLEKAITVLRDRQKNARVDHPIATTRSVFDSADLLIVDYDLLKVDQAGIETGESIAYLARCYATCGLIVTLNQFGDNNFDLGLDPRFESFADLNIGSRQLGNRGLWDQPFRGYRPWHWPLIGQALGRFKRRLVQVEQHLDEPILEFLGFTPGAVAALRKGVAELLGSAKIQTMTFHQFAEESGHGLRNRDRPLNTKSLARIAAARVAQWLESAVLPGQDVLVDAPHLVRRFPSLLRGNPTRLSDLDRTATVELSASKAGVKSSLIESHRFLRADFISRPVWFWPDVAVSERISEVVNPFAEIEVRAEFCEDLSRFAPADACRQFASSLESAFKRRYVVDPLSNWATRQHRQLDGSNDFRKVHYEPALRFAT